MSDKDKLKLRLYLIRHGESASNAGLTDGMSDEMKADPPLSEKGRVQAKLLGEYFSGLKLDAVYSSGLRRACATGSEIALRQPEGGAKKVRVHGIFTECGTGEDTRGRLISEIAREFSPCVCAPGQSENEPAIFYGADDTDEMLLDRAKKAIAYLLGIHHSGETVAVTAHAAIDTFLLYAALGLGSEQIFDPKFYNTGITRVDFMETGTGSFGDVHLVYHNAVPHLMNDYPAFRY